MPDTLPPSPAFQAQVNRAFNTPRPPLRMTLAAKVEAALAVAADHHDVDLVKRVHDGFGMLISEVERMIESEAETHAMRLALRETLDVLRAAAEEALCDPLCVLDAWDAEREARRHGDKMDRQRMERSK